MVVLGVCPACAGMIRFSWSVPRRRWSLPRMRGDDPAFVTALDVLKPFAPHARG